MLFVSVVSQFLGWRARPLFFFRGAQRSTCGNQARTLKHEDKGKHRSVHARVLKANTSRQKAREEIRKRTLVESSPNLLACCIECERGMAALFSSPSSYTSRGAARNPASAPTPVPRAEADLSVGMADTCCCALCVLLEV